MTTPIDRAELDTDSDPYGDIMYQGKFFEGVAIEKSAETGAVIALDGYDGGKPHGPQRTWALDGTLLSEEYYRWGGWHGPVRAWSGKGTLLSEEYWENGVCLRRQKWSAPDLITESFTLDPASDHAAEVARERARSGGRDVRNTF